MSQSLFGPLNDFSGLIMLIYLIFGLSSIFLGKKQLLFCLIAAGMLSDELKIISYGVSVPIWIILSLFYIVKTKLFKIHNFNNSFKLFNYASTWYVLFAVISLILGIAFTHPFFLESQYPSHNLRLWSQGYLGRSVVSTSNLVLTTIAAAGISVLLTSLGWKKIISALSLTSIILLFIALFFFFTHDSLRLALFPDTRTDLFYRIRGLCGEPRVFGQSMACMCIFFIITYKSYEKNLLVLLAIIFTFIGTFASLSATSVVALAVGLLVLFFHELQSFSSLLLIRKTFLSLIVCVALAISLFSFVPYIFTSNIYGTTNLLSKLVTFAGANDMSLTSVQLSLLDLSFFEQLISRFEVFDKLSLRFIYANPFYLFVGVGPNVISIPSSYFVDAYTYSIYGTNINSVPHIFALNRFFWMGLPGLPFLYVTALRFLRLARHSYLSHEFLLVNIFLCFFVSPPTLYLSLALAASSPLIRSSHLKLISV